LKLIDNIKIYKKKYNYIASTTIVSEYNDDDIMYDCFEEYDPIQIVNHNIYQRLEREKTKPRDLPFFTISCANIKHLERNTTAIKERAAKTDVSAAFCRISREVTDFTSFHVLSRVKNKYINIMLFGAKWYNYTRGPTLYPSPFYRLNFDGTIDVYCYDPTGKDPEIGLTAEEQKKAVQNKTFNPLIHIGMDATWNDDFECCVCFDKSKKMLRMTECKHLSCCVDCFNAMAVKKCLVCGAASEYCLKTTPIRDLIYN
jgi:hypothetical protein